MARRGHWSQSSPPVCQDTSTESEVHCCRCRPSGWKPVTLRTCRGNGSKRFRSGLEGKMLQSCKHAVRSCQVMSAAVAGPTTAAASQCPSPGGGRTGQVPPEDRG